MWRFINAYLEKRDMRQHIKHMSYESLVELRQTALDLIGKHGTVPPTALYNMTMDELIRREKETNND